MHLLLLSLLTSPAHASPPKTATWTLPGGSTPCTLSFGDDVRFRCGAADWEHVRQPTRRLLHALERLPLRRLARRSKSPNNASLATLSVTGVDTFATDDPDVLAWLEEARKAIALDDPTRVPDVPSDCAIAIHQRSSATRFGAQDGRLHSRDLFVCENGDWYGHEDGHRVAAGSLDEDALADLLHDALPLRQVQPNWSRGQATLCPTVMVVETHGLIVRGTPILRDPCGYLIRAAHPTTTALWALFPRVTAWTLLG